MTVSLCVIAYNEEAALPGLLQDILAQSFPSNQIELVFADSGSTDGTKELLKAFARDYSSLYKNVCLCDNPRRSQAAGWNTVISEARGDVIIRVDAHASIPSNFVEENMRLIEEGEMVCGGARPSMVANPTAWNRMLLTAESSLFGSSIASYRRTGGEEKEYVSSLFHGAYRREVFAEVGGFNESLGRTEDNEFHYRLRQNGFRICKSSHILSYQLIRPTLRKMLAQKFGNGKWIGLTLSVCPGCLSVFHFAPFCLVLGLLLSGVLAGVGAAMGIGWSVWPLLLLMMLYALADLLMSVTAAVETSPKSPFLLLLPGVFLVLHLAYGLGTLTGLLQIPFWKRRLDDSSAQEIARVRDCVIQHTEKTTEETL